MLNEFRQDLVSGDWVLFSTARSKGHIKDPEPFSQPKETCPFEDFIKSGQGAPILMYNQGQPVSEPSYDKEWTTVVLNNKFPAVSSGFCGPIMNDGPFKKTGAFGYHELVVTKDHDRLLHQLSIEEISELIKVYRARYMEISKFECGDYISIFHNFGPAAGGTIYHNHSQILSTPIVPPEVLVSLKGAENYYRENRRKVHDVLIEWERAEAKRVVYENEKFIVFCPFVSKTPYEMRIFPKLSNPRFETIADENVPLFADALKTAITKLDNAIKGAHYNFYIHTAPAKTGSVDDSYHWHLELVPRVKTVGGLELGINVYINEIDPDEAAEKLREA